MAHPYILKLGFSLVLATTVALLRVIGCGPEEPTPPPASVCSVTDTSGAEMRILELVDPIGASDDWELEPSLSEGDLIRMVGGSQGADMITPTLRFPALSDPESDGSERCMHVEYSGYTIIFERDLIFERKGEWWVLTRAIFDPATPGSFLLEVSVSDENLNASEAMTLNSGFGG